MNEAEKLADKAKDPEEELIPSLVDENLSWRGWCGNSER